MNLNLDDFLVEYNELLSRACLEHNGKFSVLASPTLNKQETVTLLYRDVVNQISNNSNKITKKNTVRLRLEFIARLGLMFYNLVKTSLKFRIKSLPENCIYVRTWLVPRSIQNGVVRDDYFRQLIDDMSEKNNVMVGFQPLGYGATLRQFKNTQKPANFIIPIGLLSVFDIIKIFWKYILSAKINLNNEYSFKEKDISNLINNSLKKDYFKLRSFQAFLELEIAIKINRFSPKIFLYIYENQAWENAYLTEFEETTTKTIGYQSSGFSFRFLNFFPSKLDKINSLFPSLILTVGDIFSKTMEEVGNYPVPIKTFAALRFEYPVKEGKYTVQKPLLKINRKILYAFAVHLNQYDDIMNDLIQVFANTDIEIHLKFHPLYNDRSINLILPDNFTIKKLIKMESLKEQYDLVCFNDNSFGIESLISGVKSFEYSVTDIYDETRMLDFQSYKNKINKEDLFVIRNSLLDGIYKKDYSVDVITNYINQFYKVYDNFELVSY